MNPNWNNTSDEDMVELSRLLDEHGRLRENGQDDGQVLERLSDKMHDKISRLRRNEDPHIEPSSET
jgi:hypothetical protein